jgi:hypothetical protein
MEEFKDLIGFDSNYKISNKGYVINSKGRKIGSIGQDGYNHVLLKKNGKIYNIRVHKLVWEYFGEVNPTHDVIIDHENNIKSENGIDNLQLISFRQNVNKDQKIGVSDTIGVSWSNDKKRWRAQISINNKRLHLGYRRTIAEARLLYQSALTI